MRAVTFFDGQRWRDGVVAVEDGRMRVRDERPRAGSPRLDGVIVGGFTDHHVHLQLVDHTLLADSALGRVVDLGAEPETIAGLAAAFAPDDGPRSSRSAASSPVRVQYAGAFLTAPGGYPSDRAWAPAGSWREIADAVQAIAAVAEMADAGASVVKVAGNSLAGPVLDDGLFRTLVDSARSRGLPVVAHAEGPGEAERVVRLGATILAHVPFTERLADDEIAVQAASVAWISTLAVHDPPARETAIDNLRRFHAAGGTVLYGTDMGNGTTPVDVRPAEITALRDAGIVGDDLLRALAPQDPLDPASRLLLLPGLTPETVDPLQTRPLTPEV